jgi:hypothetical protein
MKRQKQINNMLKKVSSERSVYATYGRIARVTLGQIAFIIAILPLCSAWLFAFVPKLHKYEIVRVTISKK